MISLFMHGGPVARRPARPQARADPSSTAPITAARSSTASSTGRARSSSAARGSSPATASAAPRSPSCCRERPGSSTTSAWSARCTPGTTGTRSRSATSTAGSPAIAGRPTMGSWIVYGLGSESQELPAYMVLSDPGGTPVDGTINWSSGFMPPLYQGTVLRARGAADPQPRPAAALAGQPSASRTSPSSTGSTGGTWRSIRASPTWKRGSQSYELAAAMQTAAKEALDVTSEPASIRRLYGLDQERDPRVRHALPDRPPAGRARRPVRPALPRRPALGSRTARSARACPRSASGPTSPRPRWSRTSSSAACWTRRSSTGAARSAGCRSARGTSTPAPAATTTARASRSGWPAAGSKAA